MINNMPYKEHSNIQAKNIYYMYELEKCKLCFSALKMGHVFNINELLCLLLYSSLLPESQET